MTTTLARPRGDVRLALSGVVHRAMKMLNEVEGQHFEEPDWPGLYAEAMLLVDDLSTFHEPPVVIQVHGLVLCMATAAWAAAEAKVEANPEPDDARLFFNSFAAAAYAIEALVASWGQEGAAS